MSREKRNELGGESVVGELARDLDFQEFRVLQAMSGGVAVESLEGRATRSDVAGFGAGRDRPLSRVDSAGTGLSKRAESLEIRWWWWSFWPALHTELLTRWFEKSGGRDGAPR